MGYSPITNIIPADPNQSLKDIFRAAQQTSDEDYHYDVWVTGYKKLDFAVSYNHASSITNAADRQGTETAFIVPVVDENSVSRKTVRKKVPVTEEIWEKLQVTQNIYPAAKAVAAVFPGWKVESFQVVEPLQMRAATSVATGTTKPRLQYQLVQTDQQGRETVVGVCDTVAEAKQAGKRVLDANHNVHQLKVRGVMVRDESNDLFLISRPAPARLEIVVEAKVAQLRPNPTVKEYYVTWWGHS